MASIASSIRVARPAATLASRRNPAQPQRLQLQTRSQGKRAWNPVACSAASTAPSSGAADESVLSLDEDSTPTPVLPSGTMMAEFLLAYRRMLDIGLGSGDSTAAAGENVLERVKVGVMALLGHPKTGEYAGAKWYRAEMDLESCLWELEKDIDRIHNFHSERPTRLALQLASLHCLEAAEILRKL